MEEVGGEGGGREGGGEGEVVVEEEEEEAGEICREIGQPSQNLPRVHRDQEEEEEEDIDEKTHTKPPSRGCAVHCVVHYEFNMMKIILNPYK